MRGSLGSGAAAKRLLIQFLVIAGVLVVWQEAATNLLSPSTLPSLPAVARRLLALLETASTWSNIGATLTGWVLSLTVAALISVPLGLFLGWSARAYRSSRFLIDFLRTVPPLAVIPVAGLLFGTQRATEFMIALPACCWPLLLQSIYGVRDIDPMMIETAHAFRLSRWQRIARIIVPSCGGYIYTGLRLAALMGFLLVVATELLAGVPGIGLALAYAQINGAVVDVYAYTLIVAFLGLSLSLLLAEIERRVMPWHAANRSTS